MLGVLCLLCTLCTLGHGLQPRRRRDMLHSAALLPCRLLRASLRYACVGQHGQLLLGGGELVGQRAIRLSQRLQRRLEL
jgi:hypothetical protein